jgi:hypothetical protein
VLGWAKNFLASLNAKAGIAVVTYDLVVFNPVVTAVAWTVNVVTFEVKQVVVRVTVLAADTAASIDVKICIYHSVMVANIL